PFAARCVRHQTMTRTIKLNDATHALEPRSRSVFRPQAANFLGGEQRDGDVLAALQKFQTHEHTRLVVCTDAGALTMQIVSDQYTVLLNDFDEAERLNRVNVRGHTGEVICPALTDKHVVHFVYDDLAAPRCALLANMLDEERDHAILPPG